MGKLNTTKRPSAFTEATFPFRGPPSVTIAPEFVPGESGAELTGGLAARPALASTGGLGLAQPARMAAASKIGNPDRMGPLVTQPRGRNQQKATPSLAGSAARLVDAPRSPARGVA